VSGAPADRFDVARSVADAVLYEGYVLYPYRASSRKNRARFQWGVLVPRRFSQADGSERWSSRTECLVDPGTDPVVSVRIRFLHVQHRGIERWQDDRFTPVDSLEVDGTLHVEWDEARDQVVDVEPLAVLAAVGNTEVTEMSFAGGSETESICAADGSLIGRFVRRREPIATVVRIAVSRPDPERSYVKVAVTVENTTAWSGSGGHRDDAIGHSLVAVHTMLAVDAGTFVSLLDPPTEASGAAAHCHSDGAYPVLIGQGDVVLASPIILYDRPEVAAQSPGDLYDSLEIDEILALRVMTLTDEEKSEARGTDARAAAVINRCDAMSDETLTRLHGQMRPVEPSVTAPPESDRTAGQWWDPEADAAFDPWTESVVVSGTEITKGSAVRLRPSRRADAHDLFLAGMDATVAGVFTDVDGEQHVAVTVDDDPATQEFTWQGRFLFFHPDELEPLIGEDLGR
jgi:hypothetical protein